MFKAELTNFIACGTLLIITDDGFFVSLVVHSLCDTKHPNKRNSTQQKDNPNNILFITPPYNENNQLGDH